MSGLTVTTIRLRAANAHLVTGPTGQVLVDAGTAAAVPRLRSELARLGVDPQALAAVVLTHGHADHAGGARALVGPDVPVVVGAADADILRAGQNPPLHPTTPTARLIRPFVDRRFPPYEPDVLVEAELDLAPFGLPARALVVGGHTPGSLVVIGHGPGGPAVVGDLVRGGHLGGAVRPGPAAAALLLPGRRRRPRAGPRRRPPAPPGGAARRARGPAGRRPPTVTGCPRVTPSTGWPGG